MEEDQIVEIIQTKIYSIRNQKVMLDSDIAEPYGVETKRVNEDVKSNPDEFSEDFYFKLDVNEQDFLRSKFSTLKKVGINTENVRQRLLQNKACICWRPFPKVQWLHK